MKRLMILFIAVMYAAVLSAQESDGERKVYCQLVGNSKFLSTKITVTVDFGENKSYYNSYIMDENGKAMTFNSMVDAMNFMGKYGWGFEQAYVVSSGQQNVYNWLLSKTVSDDENIKDGIHQRGDK